MKTAVVIVTAMLAVASVLASPHNSNVGESNDRCSRQQDGTRFPDFNDCRMYVQCKGGKETSKSCSSSQLFDVVTLKCTSKSNAFCFGVPTSSSSTTEEPTPVCNTAFAADCTWYWSCDTGAPLLKACLEGYFYYEPMHICLPGNVQSCELYKV